MVQPIQNQQAGVLMRPAETRCFPEGAATTAQVIAKLAAFAIASVVAFVTLPWQAAAGVTVGAAALLFLCCNPPQIEARRPPAGGVLVFPEPAPTRWFQRMNFAQFFPRRLPVHVADRRPREPVGLGQFNAPPRDEPGRPYAPRNLGREQGFDFAARRRGGGGGGGGGHYMRPVMRPPAPGIGGEREAVGRPDGGRR